MSGLTIRGGLRHAAASQRPLVRRKGIDQRTHELGFRAILVVHPVDSQHPGAPALGQPLDDSGRGHVAG